MKIYKEGSGVTWQDMDDKNEFRANHKECPNMANIIYPVCTELAVF